MHWSPVAMYCMQGFPYIGVYGSIYRDILQIAYQNKKHMECVALFGLYNAEHQQTHCVSSLIVCVCVWSSHVKPGIIRKPAIV